MGSLCTAPVEKSLPGLNMSNQTPLYVLTTYFNPCHYKVRPKQYKDFKSKIKSCSSQNVQLITIECAFGGDNFEVTSHELTDIQVRAPHPLFLKENLLNIAINKLQAFGKLNSPCHVAWIDFDIILIDPEWVQKIRTSLKSHSIVQIFKKCQCLGIHNEISEEKTSFASNLLIDPFGLQSSSIETGYGWATTNENLLSLGGLYEGNILGLGDQHMAYALIGNFNGGFDQKIKMSAGYEKSVFEWMKKVENVFQKSVGYVDMMIRHKWHGNPSSRNTSFRWELLSQAYFDPNTDLEVTKDGTLKIKDEREGLQNDIRKWFQARNEDEAFKPPIQPKPVPKPKTNKRYNNNDGGRGWGGNLY